MTCLKYVCFRIPSNQITDFEADGSQDLWLISREIIFDVFQPCDCGTLTSQTDRPSDNLPWHNRVLRSIARWIGYVMTATESASVCQLKLVVCYAYLLAARQCFKPHTSRYHSVMSNSTVQVWVVLMAETPATLHCNWADRCPGRIHFWPDFTGLTSNRLNHALRPVGHSRRLDVVFKSVLQKCKPTRHPTPFVSQSNNLKT